MGNGITEIGIVIHDGHKVLHCYESLVNPQRHIPLFIQSLTGITNDMVANAPTFNEVAAQVFELLQDKVFIAHNVNFDYSFLKYHLEQAGYCLDSRKLCTVRLARKIVPGLRHYSLGKLCHQLGITLQNHHRAGGDALATAHLFGYLLERDTEQVIMQMLRGRNKEQYLPPNLPVEQVNCLPESPGVYYFYNNAGKIIYVGKAANLIKRVKSHFANNKAGKQKQDFLREVYRISYKPTATDLMAHILESVEIRRLWPVHNRSQKGYHPRFGLFVYEDRQGFKRLAIEHNKHCNKPLYTFNTLMEGHNWLRRLIREFSLCARLCHLAREADCLQGRYAEGCEDGCQAACGPEAYNLRVDDAIAWIQKQLPTFALLDVGLDESGESCILMLQGALYGMGYIRDRQPLEHPSTLSELLEPLADNDYIRNLVLKHAAEHPHKCVRWD